MGSAGIKINHFCKKFALLSLDQPTDNFINNWAKIGRERHMLSLTHRVTDETVNRSRLISICTHQPFSATNYQNPSTRNERITCVNSDAPICLTLRIMQIQFAKHQAGRFRSSVREALSRISQNQFRGFFASFLISIICFKFLVRKSKTERQKEWKVFIHTLPIIIYRKLPCFARPPTPAWVSCCKFFSLSITHSHGRIQCPMVKHVKQNFLGE